MRRRCFPRKEAPMKILVADDELVSRKKLERLLITLGHDVLVAENGLLGQQLWKKERPRMVLTDWIMPEMDGPELCRHIRAEEGSQYTYIIMITSKEDTQDIVTGIDAGADDFITKPFVKEELLVRMRAGERMVEFETRNLVIFAMAKLAESRDLETGHHLERIRHYAKTIATHLAADQNASTELDGWFVENIFLTSPLHDIGKIGIPDHVLLKNDRLDDDEFEVIKQHTIIGYETLSEALKKEPRAEYLQMSAEIAYAHHERFDGMGYPQGLAGTDIPLSARIVALADVYDALITKRRYKKRYTHATARAIILQGKGSHFDPMVVDAFITCEPQFIKIAERFADDIDDY